MSSWGSEWWDEPLYPNGRVVRTGRCVRGWIPFEVRKGEKLDLISYAPLEWEIRG